MSKLFKADFYRIKHSRMMWNTLLILALLIIAFAATFAWVMSGSFKKMLNSAESTAAVSGFQTGVSIRTSGQDSSVPTEDEVQALMDELDVLIPNSAAFVDAVLFNNNIMLYFLLPLAIVIIGTDFSSGAIRNTLSFESNRSKIYLSKLLQLLFAALGLIVFTLIFCIVSGSVAFGFGGFSTAYWLERLFIFSLQIPAYVAMIGIMSGALILTKRSGPAIAITLSVLFLYSNLISIVTQLLPGVQWIKYLDFLSIFSKSMHYTAYSAWQLAGTIITAACVAVLGITLGLTHYKKMDIV